MALILALISNFAFAQIKTVNEYAAICFATDTENIQYIRYGVTEAEACEKVLVVCQALSKNPKSCYAYVGD